LKCTKHSATTPALRSTTAAAVAGGAGRWSRSRVFEPNDALFFRASFLRSGSRGCGAFGEGKRVGRSCTPGFFHPIRLRQSLQPLRAHVLVDAFQPALRAGPSRHLVAQPERLHPGYGRKFCPSTSGSSFARSNSACGPSSSTEHLRISGCGEQKRAVEPPNQAARVAGLVVVQAHYRGNVLAQESGPQVLERHPQRGVVNHVWMRPIHQLPQLQAQVTGV